MTGVAQHKHALTESSTNTIILLLVFAASPLPDLSTAARQGRSPGRYSNRVDVLIDVATSGEIVCHRTTPAEIEMLLGEPTDVDRDNDKTMARLVLRYPDIAVHFSKFRMYSDDPFTLRSIAVRGAKLPIEGHGPSPLINVDDLKQLSSLHDISLRKLDLRYHGDILGRLNFDTTTLWPASDKLPPGFDPDRLLREGRNPGLGLRALHEKGIDGKGIGIAILDQRLLLGHEEYASRIIRYDATRTSWLAPQSHASPIVSIAVGSKCGVAPGASVFYYALPRTDMPDNQTYCDIIDEIIAHNEASADSNRIRVINISSGTFSKSTNYDLWKATLTKAETAGILVVTCSDRFLEYGTLKLTDGKDPDLPESYARNKYGRGNDVLQIPTGNKTIASYRGANVYTYERGDGKSWAAPYIAGLAALAFQVDPNLKPQTIVEHLVKTTTRTKAGPVVNPHRFIKTIRTQRIVAVAQRSSVDRSTPEATTRSWTRAVAGGNVKDALACMLPDGPDYDEFGEILNAEPSSAMYPVKSMLLSIDVEKPLRILDRQLTEEEADVGWEFIFRQDVTGDATVGLPSFTKGQSFRSTAKLEKYGDYWLIHAIRPSGAGKP